MYFVDEAKIEVLAGRGGNGCLSFRRERNLPRGGPDGGDGGDGGSVWLQATDALNTLADFRYTRQFKAGRGLPGSGNNRTGAGGDDKTIIVPAGTIVQDADEQRILGDLTEHGQRLLVARGGLGGRGNLRFKSSVNRAPRRTTDGQPGDQRRLALELQVLADVGLLGMPNAGKSTLLRAVSQARPRVADYPFTTLHPELGVVSLSPGRSFVVADIPGLIEGASQGAGLGFQFLRHVSRTRLLLHLVDIAPVEGSRSPAQDVLSIVEELAQYDETLAARERWLVVNKMDALGTDGDAFVADLVQELNWQGPTYAISAIAGHGCQALMENVYQWLSEQRDADARAAEQARDATEPGITHG